MRVTLLKIVQTFGYQTWGQLAESLAPSLKYNITGWVMAASAASTLVGKLFGLDALAFLFLLLAFVFELVSGIMASRARGEQIESMKLSRFSFKAFYYLTIIALAWLMSLSFEAKGKDVAATFFAWLHVFFVIQIVLENLVSVSENMSTLSGKPKSHWITLIQEKVTNLFK